MPEVHECNAGWIMVGQAECHPCPTCNPDGSIAPTKTRERIVRALVDRELIEPPLVGPSLNITKYIMREVKNQGYEPGTPGYTEACTCLALAWGFMQKVPTEALSVELVELLGNVVHPWINSGGFRAGVVMVGGEVKAPAENIPRLMTEWVEAVKEGRLNPNEAYVEFENIHPFGDGNGRTGKILFNWFNNTLDDPVWPKVPEHWAIP